MKVAELTGAKLDYWVGKANDIADLNIINGRCFHGNYSKEWVKLYSPSTDWACGGPIIEQEKIRWQPLPDEGKVFCCFRHLCGVLIKISCLSYQVQRDVGYRDVLFEDRTMSCPFAVTMPEDEGIVGEVECILKKIGHY